MWMTSKRSHVDHTSGLRRLMGGDSVFTVKDADGKPAVPVVIDLISLGLLKGVFLLSCHPYRCSYLKWVSRLDATLCHRIDRIGVRNQGQSSGWFCRV